DIVFNSPIIGDLNGDNRLDVLFSNYDELYAINGRNGTKIWSYGDIVLYTPILVDLNNDSWLELVVGNTGKVVVYEILGAGFRTYWPKEFGNNMHTGNLQALDCDLDSLSDSSERHVGTDPRNWDTDGDGMPDGWEVTYGLNATDSTDADLDPDSDTLTNLEEYHLGTDPLCADTDGDGIADAEDKHPTVYDKSLSEYLGDIAEGISEFFVRNPTVIVLTVSIAILLVTLYTGLRKRKRE
ncbi:MAG: hypothetical protein ACTSU6_05695, partial [Candidatus Njordarchaeales archaeon]